MISVRASSATAGNGGSRGRGCRGGVFRPPDAEAAARCGCGGRPRGFSPAPPGQTSRRALPAAAAPPARCTAPRAAPPTHLSPPLSPASLHLKMAPAPKEQKQRKQRSVSARACACTRRARRLAVLRWGVRASSVLTLGSAASQALNDVRTIEATIHLHKRGAYVVHSSAMCGGRGRQDGRERATARQAQGLAQPRRRSTPHTSGHTAQCSALRLSRSPAVCEPPEAGLQNVAPSCLLPVVWRRRRRRWVLGTWTGRGRTRDGQRAKACGVPVRTVCCCA